MSDYGGVVECDDPQPSQLDADPHSEYCKVPSSSARIKMIAEECRFNPA